MATPHELPPNPSRLIEGLRDTGYDFNTALADIVDNSVDADASKVHIWMRMDMEGEITVTVADNGCGMDAAELLNAMTYGAVSGKAKNRLGKFGLGLKTASTAFCRRLSVITRAPKSTKCERAAWDLDHVVRVNKWELLLGSPSAEELRLLDEVATGHSGTLVIWDKVDRILKAYQNPSGGHAQRALKKVEDEFRAHAAMVYQRFLDPKDKRARTIEILLNGRPVVAWDPFCELVQGTELVAKDTVPVELSTGKKAEFTVRAFVLPRREQFSSDKEARAARLENKMQGIYIYRENRLIHPHDWLGMFSKEPHGTLLRVEFSFDHRLDDAFHVDIKKSRILLNEDLYDWMLTQFLPAPRNAADERYRKGQRERVQANAASAHAESNAAIKSKEEELRQANITVTDAARDEVEVENRQGRVRIRLTLAPAQAAGQLNVQAVPSINDGLLWEPGLIQGHHAVRINTGHPYYHKVYVPNLLSGVTIQGMDSLLWALVEAELGTISETTKTHFQELRFEVSRLLRRLVEDLPDPEEAEAVATAND